MPIYTNGEIMRIVTIHCCPHGCNESENCPSSWFVCPKCGADIIEQDVEIQERDEGYGEWT